MILLCVVLCICEVKEPDDTSLCPSCQFVIMISEATTAQYIKHLKNHRMILLIASLRVSVVITERIPQAVHEKEFFFNIRENARTFKTNTALIWKGGGGRKGGLTIFFSG